MAYGYNGKMVRVSLSTGKIAVEEKDWLFYRTYMGGRGIISYFLLNEVPADSDPLSEQNKLICATSVMTGSAIPGFGRHSVGAKSPLTNLYGESQAGGYWGAELKRAGFDALIVEGKAAKPVYLWINDGKVEIKDAAALWGRDTADVQEQLAEALGEKRLRALIIGKAGENMVRVAGIAADVTHYHGRTGMGAVMGSKNLKAIAVRGTQGLQFADPDKIKQLAQWFSERFKDNADNKAHNQYGTSPYYWNANFAGSLPTRNFNSGYFEGAEKLSLEETHKLLKIKTSGCYACPVRCKQIFQDEEPYKIDPRYGGPEYETIAAFNSTCGVDDVRAAAKAHELCNRYGLDTVSSGVIIAFAMECYENRLITKEDTEGIDLSFGNAEGMLTMLEKMAAREGFGDVLAEGVKRAAEKIGKGAQQYAMHVKGQEFAMAEPRAKFGVGLAYAVSPTGADHLQHEHDGAFDPNLTGYSHDAEDASVFLQGVFPLGILEPVESLYLGAEKVRLFTYLQHYWSLFDTLDLCLFMFAPVRTFRIPQLVEMVRAVTGWETSLWELMKVGERSTTLTRAFNVRHGATKEDDKLPGRMFEGLKGGPLSGSKMDRAEFEKSLPLYYEMMGWDKENGVPQPAKLYELSIGWVCDHIRDKQTNRL